MAGVSDGAALVGLSGDTNGIHELLPEVERMIRDPK
jgi:hypothetical protein